MSQSSIDLGTDTDGITFKWTGSDDRITAAGELEINVWNSYDERSWVTTSSPKVAISRRAISRRASSTADTSEARSARSSIASRSRISGQNDDATG